MIRELTKTEKYLITVVGKSPPIHQIEQSLFYKLTPDQLEYYQNERAYWYLVSIGLEGYFSGKGSYLSIEKVLDKDLDKEDWKLLLAEFDKWVSFYSMMDCGWKNIRSYFSKMNIPLRFKNPGEAFEVIQSCESILYFSNCLLPHYVYSPGKAHREYKNYKKIFNKINSKKTLTKSEQELIDKLDKEIQLHPYKIFIYGAAFQDYFANLLSKSKDKRIKEKSKDYLKADGELERVKLSRNHPSIRKNGFAFAKGNKKIGMKGGYA